MPAWTRARQPSGAAGHHPPPRRRAAWVFFGSSQGVCGGVPLTDQTPMPPSPDQVPGMQDRPPAGAAQRPQVRPVGQTPRGHRWGGPVDDHRRRTLPARLTDRVRLPVGSAACLPDPSVQQTGGHGGYGGQSSRRTRTVYPPPDALYVCRSWQRGGSASAARRCCSLLSSYLLGAETHRKPLPCSGLWWGSTDALPP